MTDAPPPAPVAQPSRQAQKPERKPCTPKREAPPPPSAAVRIRRQLHPVG